MRRWLIVSCALLAWVPVAGERVADLAAEASVLASNELRLALRQSLIREEVADRVRSRDAVGEMLAVLYARGDGTPLWTSPEGEVTRAARQAAETLGRAADDGLDPLDYAVHAPTRTPSCAPVSMDPVTSWMEGTPAEIAPMI